MLSFVEYCHSKSINATSFKEKEEKLYQDLEFYFDQVHPDSFTAQKLFLINEIRRRHHFIKPEKEKVAKKTSVPKTAGKPMIGVKPKTPLIKKPAINKVEEGKEVTKTSAIKPKISKPIIAKKDSNLKEVKSEKAGQEKSLSLKPKIAIPNKAGGALKPKIPVKSKKTEDSKSITSEDNAASDGHKVEEVKKDKPSALKPKIAIPKRAGGALKPKIPVKPKKTEDSKSITSEDNGIPEEHNLEEVKKNKPSVLKPKIAIPKKAAGALKPKIPVKSKKTEDSKSITSEDKEASKENNLEEVKKDKPSVLKPKIATPKKVAGALKPKIPVKSKTTISSEDNEVSSENKIEEVKKGKPSALKPKIPKK